MNVKTAVTPVIARVVALYLSLPDMPVWYEKYEKYEISVDP